MKACWLFIGEWTFVGIAAPYFQALLCNVINNFSTNNGYGQRGKNKSKDKRNYPEYSSDIIRNHRITQTKLIFIYGPNYYVLSSSYYTYMSLRKFTFVFPCIVV